MRNLANFARSKPIWYSVALFFCVRAISASTSLIFSATPIVSFAQAGRERASFLH